MRWYGSLYCLLGLTTACLTVAGANEDRPPSTRGRTAQLLAPQILDSGEVPLARAQAEAPPPLGMTPVRRSSSTPLGISNQTSASDPTPAAPPWLSGTAASNLVPAAAQIPTSNISPDAPGPLKRHPERTDDSWSLARWFSPEPRSPSTIPTQSVATANTPFQGPAPNGTIIYAGPPAYRWYGYGAAQPPAFVQIQGRYPPASADWYRITGATPGAFPVPIPSSADTLPGLIPTAAASPNQLTNNTRPHSPSSARTTNSPPDRSVYPSAPPPILPTPSQLQQPTTNPPITPPASSSVIPSSALQLRNDHYRIRNDHYPTVATVPVSSANVPPPGIASPPPTVFTPTATSSMHAPSSSPAPPDQRDVFPWMPADPSSPRNKLSPAVNQPWSESRAIPQSSSLLIVRGQMTELTQQELSRLIEKLTAGQVRQLRVQWLTPDKAEISWETSAADQAEWLVQLISARPELQPFHLDFRIIIR